MRFRRRAPKRRTARRMHGDWVVGIDHNCGLPIPSDQPCTGGGTDPGTFLNDTLDFSLIDTSDIQDKEDALTVVRVVGDLPMFASIRGVLADNSFLLRTITVREGIYVSTVDPNGVAIDMDPRTAGDMESDCWLYLRTRTFKFAAVGVTGSHVCMWQSGADYSQQQNDHLDLRVKRKLKRGQELIYTAGGFFEEVDVAQAGVVNAVVFSGHLRCYVKY